VTSAFRRFKRSETGEALKYAQILTLPLGNYRFTEQYEADGIVVEENSAEDIRDLALEMLEQCRGGVQHSREDEIRQHRFRALFRSGHYSYGSKGRAGRDFLAKYAHLIE
jgi:putative glycosyltransferase (TIGR04372 family)